MGNLELVFSEFIWSHEDDELVTLTIDGEVIITTTDHPFYTDSGEWVLAGDLQIGDAVVSADGDFGTVDAVVITDGTAEVYNLTVDEAHTYFVGVGEWLVHNCPDPNDTTKRKVVVELFSGPNSQIDANLPEYQDALIVNVEIEPYVLQGIRADALNLPIARNSADEVFVTNPFVESLRDLPNFDSAVDGFRRGYFDQIASIIKNNGLVIISRVNKNPFAGVLNGQELLPELRDMGFNLLGRFRRNQPIWQPLHPALQNTQFGRPDGNGDIINQAKMRSIYLTWRKP